MAEETGIQTKKLIILIGLPKSGKTTHARKLGFPIVCPDAIRLATHGMRYWQPAERMVWALAHQMVRSLFLAGHDTVVLDATNVSKARRDDWISKEWVPEFHVLATPHSVCVERAIAANDQCLLPIIDKMSEELDLDGVLNSGFQVAVVQSF